MDGRSALPLEISLDQVAPGTWVEVLDVQGPLPWRRRLYALGIRPGSRVYVEHRAPLGDPMQYWVQGTWLALRRGTARYIRVKVLPQEKEALPFQKGENLQ